MMAVVGFKLMEWWYGTAETQMQKLQTLPVPPPPPRPRPHPDGLALPTPGAGGRGLQSSTFRLNVSAFCRTRGV